MELLNNFPEMNQSQPQLPPPPPPSSCYALDYFSKDNFLSNVAQSNEQLHFDLPVVQENNPNDQTHFSAVQSSSVFGGRNNKNNSIAGRKRKRKNDDEVEKPKEVIHVRAKRGQATDSHSLAERVRRERINEKLKVLQDLVPGCYKTMGMAVMLDVIINYVRSLQNQIEFLSMKLSAASMFYDFNSPEAEAIENLQRTTNSYDAHEMERVAKEGYGEMLPRLHSSWPF